MPPPLVSGTVVLPQHEPPIHTIGSDGPLKGNQDRRGPRREAPRAPELLRPNNHATVSNGPVRCGLVHNVLEIKGQARGRGGRLPDTAGRAADQVSEARSVLVPKDQHTEEDAGGESNLVRNRLVWNFPFASCRAGLQSQQTNKRNDGNDQQNKQRQRNWPQTTRNIDQRSVTAL